MYLSFIIKIMTKFICISFDKLSFATSKIYKMYWEKLSHDEITAQIDAALEQNMNYKTKKILGVPASYLDEEQFYDDAPFLEDSPFMKTLIANPNHIGCHTLNEDSEPFFKGTQKIEIDLIKLCAEEILGGKDNFRRKG